VKSSLLLPPIVKVEAAVPGDVEAVNSATAGAEDVVDDVVVAMELPH
jgi:hypothetical protein